MELSRGMPPVGYGNDLIARTHQREGEPEEEKNAHITIKDDLMIRADSIATLALPPKSPDAPGSIDFVSDDKNEGLAEREIKKEDLPRNPVFNVTNGEVIRETEVPTPKSPQLIAAINEGASAKTSEAPSLAQPSMSHAASERARVPDPSDALLNPEDVPRSQNIYDINRLTAELQEFRRIELEYMIYIACIDNEMRETITLVWSGANCLLQVVDDLLQRNEGARDFVFAQRSLSAKFALSKKEELDCYKSLLGARDAIISKGQRVPITRELKAQLLQEYEALVDKRFADIAKEFTEDSLNDLDALKAKMEDIIEEKLLLKDDLLESKVALHMESEDRKTTDEYRALVQARKKLTADALASDLWEAAESGDVDKLKEELQKCSFFARLRDPEKRFINRKSALGYTPLVIACHQGHETCVVLLLEAVASRKIRDNNGYQALHWAARGGFTQICKLLLDRGMEILDVPALVPDDKGEKVGVYRDRKGKEFGGYERTPLHRAAYHGHHETVRLLLNCGANPNLLTSKQNGHVTPLHEAIQQGRTEVLVELLRRKIDPYRPGVVIPELQHRVDLKVETPDIDGRTALWWAISLGRTDYAAKIIAHPSYVRKKDPKDPNSRENLLFIVPPPDKKDEVKKFLEGLQT